MSFMGGPPMGTMPGGQAGNLSAQQMQEQQMIKTMQGVMESCPGKVVMAGVMGFALGGAFGLFMSSMRYDTPMSTPVPGSAPGAPVKAFTDLPIREQLRHGLKDMGKATYSSAKNFALIGSVFTGTECCVEGLRAKNDIYNGLTAGCLTGGALARNSGPQGVAIGCLGFAAFSAAIDTYMKKEEDERRFPVV